MDTFDLHKKNQGKLEIKTKVPLETKQDLSLLYTPGVGKVSKAIAEDKEKVNLYTNKKNTVAIITDGSAVLGLGDIGPEAALPVMEGKSVLFKKFGNIDAYPILLKTRDIEEIVETVLNISPTFSGINLEDISAPRCFDIEKKLKEKLDIPVFHDDQHGTAIVVLAALINTIKIAKKNISDIKIVINGAGAAGIAIHNLLTDFGAKNICLLDSKGAICKQRNDLNPHKKAILHASDCQCGSLGETIECADVFIGVSRGNILTKELIGKMTEKPIIFALANPIPEISYEEAKSAGAFIAATGSSEAPNQINNALVFPGMFRGILDANAHRIDNEIKIFAAETIASSVSELGSENIMPDIMDLNFHKNLAKKIKEFSCTKVK